MAFRLVPACNRLAGTIDPFGSIIRQDHRLKTDTVVLKPKRTPMLRRFHEGIHHLGTHFSPIRDNACWISRCHDAPPLSVTH
jgi:hypothetical protein